MKQICKSCIYRVTFSSLWRSNNQEGHCNHQNLSLPQIPLDIWIMSSSIDPSQASAKSGAAPAAVTEAVLVRSVSMPDTAVTVEGPDFNKDLSLHELLEKYTRVGFQATSIGRAIKVINDMVSLR